MKNGHSILGIESRNLGRKILTLINRKASEKMIGPVTEESKLFLG
jgi:hypothetical protein